MKNTYNNFNTNIYPSLPASVVYNNKSHNEVFNEFFNNVVETYPDPTPVRGRQKARRPLRVCVYKDFKATETKNAAHTTLWTVEYIPTGEVVTTEAVPGTIGWFVWWWYNGRG